MSISGRGAAPPHSKWSRDGWEQADYRGSFGEDDGCQAGAWSLEEGEEREEEEEVASRRQHGGTAGAEEREGQWVGRSITLLGHVTLQRSPGKHGSVQADGAADAAAGSSRRSSGGGISQSSGLRLRRVQAGAGAPKGMQFAAVGRPAWMPGGAATSKPVPPAVRSAAAPPLPARMQGGRGSTGKTVTASQQHQEQLGSVGQEVGGWGGASSTVAASPLQHMLQQVHGMITNMETICGGADDSGSRLDGALIEEEEYNFDRDTSVDDAGGDYEEVRGGRLAPTAAAHGGGASKGACHSRGAAAAASAPAGAVCKAQRPKIPANAPTFTTTRGRQQKASSSTDFIGTTQDVGAWRADVMLEGAGAAAVRSPDKHAVRGKLHGVQQRLERLEEKMLRASALQDTSCALDSECRCEAPGGGVAGGRGGACAVCARGLQHSPCRTGCAGWARARRVALVAGMQHELGQLEGELSSLKGVLPAAFTATGW